MKLSQISKTTTLALICALPLVASAGDKFGNGGHGIVRGEEILLLDFIEAGVEDAVVIDTSKAPDPKLLKLVKEKVPFVNAELLTQKLMEVKAVDSLLFAAHQIALTSYRWSLIDRSLRKVHDDLSPLLFENGEKVQVAVRSGMSVRVTRDLFERMPEEHREGLVMHEILYGLSVAGNLSIDDSRIARQVNVILFEPLDADKRYEMVKLLSESVLPLHPETRKGRVRVQNNHAFLNPQIWADGSDILIEKAGSDSKLVASATRACEKVDAGQTHYTKSRWGKKERVINTASYRYWIYAMSMSFNFEPTLGEFRLSPMYTPGQSYYPSYVVPAHNAAIEDEDENYIQLTGADSMKTCVAKILKQTRARANKAKRMLE